MKEVIRISTYPVSLRNSLCKIHFNVPLLFQFFFPGDPGYPGLPGRPGFPGLKVNKSVFITLFSILTCFYQSFHRIYSFLYRAIKVRAFALI